jgi:hypothetical protein
MKTFTFIAFLTVSTLFVSCSGDTVNNEAEAPETQTETAAPAEDDNSTSVKVGPDGVEVKSGNTNVSVGKDSGSVEIKRP